MRVKSLKILFLAAIMALNVMAVSGCNHSDDPNSVGKRTNLSETDSSDSLPDSQDVSVYKFSILTDEKFRDNILGELMTAGDMSDQDLAKLRENGIEFIGYINEGGETIIVNDVDENGKPYNKFSVVETKENGTMILNLGTDDAPKYIRVHKNSLGEYVVDLDSNNAIVGDELATGRLDKRNKESEEKSDDSSDSD